MKIDLEDMINQAIRNKIDQEFQSGNTIEFMVNQAIHQRLNSFFGNSVKEEDSRLCRWIDEVIHNKICNQFGSMNLFKKVTDQLDDSISSYIEEYFKDWNDLEDMATTFNISQVRKEESK